MSYALWALIIGALLILMVLAGTLLKRLPVSTAMLYLAVGYGLSPTALNLMSPNPLVHAAIFERMCEIAVLISLFSVGLKLGLPLSDRGWRLPVRLAVISMIVSVALTTLIGITILGLSLGASVLLGAILAPTDPVLASDVQVLEADDRDRLRFSLTGEGGLNDGTAFPFVVLGLGLLGAGDLGIGGWRWIAIDLLWAVAGGLLIGGTLGALIGQLVVFLRSRYKESVGLDEFLALGLIAMAFGLALLSHTNGFLAVLAAGLALQRVKERPGSTTHMKAQGPGLQTTQRKEALSTHTDYASASMTQEVLEFNEQLGRVAEVGIVMVLGGMLSYSGLPEYAVWLVVLLFLVVRPIAVWVGLLGANVSRDQHVLISWFGIRGIGSIYYLMYAINHGLPDTMASEITALTLTVVVASIVFHGVSVTPLMKLYSRRSTRTHPGKD